MRRPRTAWLPLAGAFAASLYCLSRFGIVHQPFPWVWVIWTCAFAWTARLLRGGAVLAAASLAALTAVLLVAEIYLNGGFAVIGIPCSFSAEYKTQDTIDYGGPLGHLPVRNARIESRKMDGGRVVYDAVYSIDENGFRRTPPLPAASPAVVFLGGSIPFGEGVGDAEAFPAVFQSSSGLKAINLAYRGYGPHRMLQLLENDRERPATARYRPFRAFALFKPEQAAWAAGNALWDLDAPRYELDASGRLHSRGFWRDRLAAHAIQLLYRSAVFGWCWGHWPHAAYRENARDLERFAAIIAELRRVFRERYHGDLEVLLWDRGASASATPRIMELLRDRGVAVVRLTDAVPELNRPELYSSDGHPGAELHRALGLYLARRVEPRGRR